MNRYAVAIFGLLLPTRTNFYYHAGVQEFPRTIRGQFDRAYFILGTTRKGVVRARVAQAIGLGVDAMQKWDQGQTQPDGVVPALVAAVDKIEEEEKFAKIRRDRTVSDWKTRAIRALDILPDEQIVEFAMKLDKAAAIHQAVGEYRADVLAVINGQAAAERLGEEAADETIEKRPDKRDPKTGTDE